MRVYYDGFWLNSRGGALEGIGEYEYCDKDFIYLMYLYFSNEGIPHTQQNQPM